MANHTGNNLRKWASNPRSKDWKDGQAKRSKSLWSNPEWRKKTLEARKMAPNPWDNSEYRKKTTASIRASHNSPTYLAKVTGRKVPTLVLQTTIREYLNSIFQAEGSGEIFHPDSICDAIHIWPDGKVELIEFKIGNDQLRPKQLHARKLLEHTSNYIVMKFDKSGKLRSVM